MNDRTCTLSTPRHSRFQPGRWCCVIEHTGFCLCFQRKKCLRLRSNLNNLAHGFAVFCVLLGDNPMTPPCMCGFFNCHSAIVRVRHQVRVRAKARVRVANNPTTPHLPQSICVSPPMMVWLSMHSLHSVIYRARHFAHNVHAAAKTARRRIKRKEREEREKRRRRGRGKKEREKEGRRIFIFDLLPSFSILN